MLSEFMVNRKQLEKITGKIVNITKQKTFQTQVVKTKNSQQSVINYYELPGHLWFIGSSIKQCR